MDDAERENWGKRLWEMWINPPETEPDDRREWMMQSSGVRQLYQHLALRFRGKCVAKHKALEDAARAFFAASDRDAALKCLSAALLAIDLSIPHGRLADDAKTALPDQGEAPAEEKPPVSDMLLGQHIVGAIRALITECVTDATYERLGSIVRAEVERK